MNFRGSSLLPPSLHQTISKFTRPLFVDIEIRGATGMEEIYNQRH